MGVNGVDVLGLALYAFDGTNNYIGQTDRGKITKKMLRNSHLFLLDTTQCVQEDKLPVDIGCLLCGYGKIRQTDASIDERTLLEWRMGVTDQERVIIHTKIYEILKENGMTGFKPKSLIKTYYPDNYLLMLWRGASRDYLNNYPEQEVFENFIKEEYGSDRFMNEAKKRC